MASRSRERLSRCLELALWLRVLAACGVQWLSQRRGNRCLFPDTEIYWMLGQAIQRREPYEVSQWGIPHFALRAPAYPLFLAFSQACFGDRAMPARLLQAALGILAILTLAKLVDRLTEDSQADSSTPWLSSSPALIAAAIATVDPFTVGFSAVLLSEALFTPLLVLGLWGLACLWQAAPHQSPAQRPHLLALVTGASWGAAILTKPSFALFPPAALLCWLLFAGKPHRQRALASSLLIAVGLAAIMAPWWARNYRLFDRFVPTALWTGASLYDGLRPSATGASDMTFLNAPDLRSLHEEAQDATLIRRALDFAASHPRRVVELAAIKAARYWSPWPNAESVRSPLARLVCAAWMLPLYALILKGAWNRRKDPRALVLLAGPLLYFAAIHMIFVSSIRYRIPAMLPAFGLAAIACRRRLANH